MVKSVQANFSTVFGIADMAEQCEKLRALRVHRAAQSWHYYLLESEVPGAASIIAPPEWDAASATAVSNHYQLDLGSGRCSCPDQQRIDGIAAKIAGAGYDWDAVGGQLLCKHFCILAFIKCWEATLNDRARNYVLSTDAAASLQEEPRRRHWFDEPRVTSRPSTDLE